MDKQELIARIRAASLEAARDETKDKYASKGGKRVYKRWYGYKLRY